MMLNVNLIFVMSCVLVVVSALSTLYAIDADKSLQMKVSIGAIIIGILMPDYISPMIEENIAVMIITAVITCLVVLTVQGYHTSEKIRRKKARATAKRININRQLEKEHKIYNEIKELGNQ